jgi:exopolysaccharide biosynthesis protein
LLGACAVDDFDVIKWKDGPYKPLDTLKWSGKVASTGRTYTAYMATTSDNSLFSFTLPENGCKVRNFPSDQAKIFNCQAMTNAGFFSFKGACTANMIIDGKVELWENPNRTNFGVIEGERTTVVGYVTNPEDFKFSSLVSGFGWMIRNGSVYVDHNREFPNPKNNSFVHLKAPRTAIGVKHDGSIFLSVVDGIEATGEGLDLYEYAEILREKGAYHAVNLDGGGSSDFVLNGRVWSWPNCDDKPDSFCERAVTTTSCIRYPS